MQSHDMIFRTYFPFCVFDQNCITETQRSNFESKHLFKIGKHSISVRQFDENNFVRTVKELKIMSKLNGWKV